LKAVFMGTPEFAVPSLEALHAIAEVVGVVCQPDRPAGRGMQMHAPPVKVCAQRLGLEVIQPTKVRDGSLAKFVRDKGADVALVVAYGRILPPDVLAAPRVGCFNVHASLLPKYRGAAPIVWAIARGEKETGVDLMRMEEGLDTGPVLAEVKTPIDPDETAGDLSKRLSKLAGDLVRESLPLVVEKRLPEKPQDHAHHTLAPMLKKEDGVVDWNKGARAIHDHVRAMQPWPGASTKLADGRALKIVRTHVVEGRVLSTIDRAPGVIVVADKSGAIVACGERGDESIAVVEAQPEGKRAMRAADLVNGRVLSSGVLLR
jgi:methionyl-tRNA formyltransferase